MADEDYSQFDEKITKVIATATVNVLVGTVVSQLVQLLATNYSQKTFAGDKDVTPTNDKTALEESNTSGVQTNSNADQQEVNASKGQVDAANTEAQASGNKVMASQTDTNAVTNTTEALDTRVGTEIKT